MEIQLGCIVFLLAIIAWRVCEIADELRKLNERERSKP